MRFFYIIYFIGLNISFGQNFHKDSILLVNYKDSAVGIFSREGVRFLINDKLSELKVYKSKPDSSLDRPFGTLKAISLKNEIYFIYPGGGIIYKYKNGSFNRIDSSYKFNNSYESKLFTYKGEIYSLGGYGFWSGIDYLTKYNQFLGTWTIVETLGDKPGSIIGGSIQIIGNELWLLNYSNLITNSQKLKNIPNVYKLNLNTNVWEKEGVINEHFLELFKDSKSYKSISINDSLYFFSPTNSITAKVHIPSNKVNLGNSFNKLYNISYLDQLIKFRDSIFYATYSVQEKKDLVRVVSYNPYTSFNIQESIYFQRNNTIILFYGLSLLFIIIILPFFIIFFLRSRRNNYSLDNGVLSNGLKKISIDEIDGARFFLEQLSKNKFISNNDLLTFFNDESITMDMVTKRKNKMILLLEVLLNDHFKTVLFERVRDPEDNRQAIFKLKKGKSITHYFND